MSYRGFWEKIDAWASASEDEVKRTQAQLQVMGWRLLQHTDEGHWRAGRRYEGILTAATAALLLRKVTALPESRKKKPRAKKPRRPNVPQQADAEAPQ